MTSTPDWFWPAVEAPRESKAVEVEGCEIHYQTWGSADKPGLLLVHGHNAHSHWWDFIAPSFTDDFHVVAPDLSGMGDSDHRDTYSPELYAQEIAAVLEAEAMAPALVVGHSFGGRMAMYAVASHPQLIRSLVLVDSGIRRPGGEEERDLGPEVQRAARPKVYPSREAAISRFRLQPPQTCDNGYIVNYIAHHSVEAEEDGWVWKFDEELMMRFRVGSDPEEVFRSLACPLALIYGEKSRSFNRDSSGFMQEIHPKMQVVELQDAQHHLFLDQPLAFIQELKKLLHALNRQN